jgi:hypothetical protein
VVKGDPDIRRATIWAGTLTGALRGLPRSAVLSADGGVYFTLRARPGYADFLR